jgi:hypothetical protein
LQLAPGAAKAKAASSGGTGEERKQGAPKREDFSSVEADKLGSFGSQRQGELCSGWQKWVGYGVDGGMATLEINPARQLTGKQASPR